MKALDKVFDTQVITGIIGDKFHFIEAKENFYMKKERNRQERRYQSYTVTEENPTEFIKVKVNGTLNDVIKLQIIWFNWFWKFNW